MRRPLESLCTHRFADVAHAAVNFRNNDLCTSIKEIQAASGGKRFHVTPGVAHRSMTISCLQRLGSLHSNLQKSANARMI